MLYWLCIFSKRDSGSASYTLLIYNPRVSAWQVVEITWSVLNCISIKSNFIWRQIYFPIYERLYTSKENKLSIILLMVHMALFQVYRVFRKLKIEFSNIIKNIILREGCISIWIILFAYLDIFKFSNPNFLKLIYIWLIWVNARSLFHFIALKRL